MKRISSSTALKVELTQDIIPNAKMFTLVLIWMDFSYERCDLFFE